MTSLAAQSVELLEIAKRLVTVITAEYSNPAALRQADAMVIDLAGRQRMLAQRLSKNACLTSVGTNAGTSAAELQAASDTFGTTLSALYVGMPEMGIQAPPNADIEAGLAKVQELWTQVAPLAAEAVAGAALDAEQLEVMFHGGNGLTGGMNAVVGMYAEATTFEG